MLSQTAMQNLYDSSTIMLIGMGVVFAFLVVMVWIMDLNAIVIKKLNEIFPEEIPQENKPSKKSQKEEDEKIALAIAIAAAKAQGHI